jgi:hypothetical protein
MRTRLWCLASLLVLCRSVHGGDAEQPVRRYRIEILYTIHARVDSDAKLERLRHLVLAVYPDAKFEEPSIPDCKIYYGTFRDRLLAQTGLNASDLRKKGMAYGYDVVKEQVRREVRLRAIYDFLHAQAKDGVSLKVIFDKLKAKDDPKDPVCSTEPGKGLLVYRDFEGKPLSGAELAEIEDSGVKFGIGFRVRVAALGDTGLPKVCDRAYPLGDEGDGRQAFRLLEVIRSSAGTSR